MRESLCRPGLRQVKSPVISVSPPRLTSSAHKHEQMSLPAALPTGPAGRQPGEGDQPHQQFTK